MATDRDWADALFAQAKEDLIAAQAAFEAGAPSTFCMLMQMVFEKLAKAAFARGGARAPQRHQVAARLVAVLRRTPGSAAVMIGGPHSLLALEELENAHPAVVADAVRRGIAQQYPQLEYPWLNPTTDQVEWSGQHLPIARRVADPEDPVAAHLLKSARALVKHFDTLFP